MANKKIRKSAKKTSKKIFTIEQLGCPLVQYRYKGGTLKDHLIAFGGGVSDLPTKYMGMDVEFDEFHEGFKSIVTEVMQDAVCELPCFDTLPGIEPVMPKIDYIHENYPQVAIDRWQLTFSEEEADTYGMARQLSDSLPWDEIVVRVNDRMADLLRQQDGFCAWEAWTPDKSDAVGYDGRWVNLYISTDERRSATAYYDCGTATEYNQFRLDEIIRKAAAVKGRQWRNYCHVHSLPVVHEAMDFMCWVLDNRIDFEQFLSEIGVVYDPYSQCTRPELDADIFAAPQQTAAMVEAPQTAEVEAPAKEIKTESISDNNNNPQTDTTTMEQTNATNNTIPAGWKAQPSRMDMTTEEFTSIYFDRFFKEQIGKIRIEPKFTVLDLYNLKDATVAWQAKEDGGAQVALTIEYKSVSFYFMYDMKNNGARDSRAVIDGKLYQFVSLSKMGECIPQFVNTTPPANVRDYLKAEVSVADKDSLNLNRKPKNSKPKAEQPKTEEKPQPQTAPTAKVRKEPIAQQTEPQAPQTTEQPKGEAPKVEMKPKSGEYAEASRLYFDAKKKLYYMLRQETEEGGINGDAAAIKEDGSVYQHVTHRDFWQMAAFVAETCQPCDTMPEAVRVALIKCGIMNAMEVSAPKTEEKPQPKDTTKDYIKQHVVVSGGEQMTYKVVDKFVEQTEPQETPTKEIKGNQEQPKKVEPEAKVIPFTLPGEITISNIKTGSMTLNGLTDLTAEQISIFVAGMNAMREAIRKQMTANA